MRVDPNFPDLPCYFHKSRPCSCDRTFRALARFAYTDWFHDDPSRRMTPEQRWWCMWIYREAGDLVDPLSDRKMETFSDRFLAGTAIIALFELERTTIRTPQKSWR
jgi:hypothetical protein